MLKIPAPEFDLEKTLNSGQVFHWIAAEGGFYGLIGERPIFVRQRDRTLLIEGGAPTTLASPGSTSWLRQIAAHYFALDHPLAQICKSFPKDPLMNAAADYCRGLRIIRQPKWECLATFICSSMKQVAHIRRISHALRERLGEPRRIRGRALHTFPDAAAIAQSSEKELRKCGLGYRAKNLLATAGQVSSGAINIEQWATLTDTELKSRLCGLPGVGPKVANCVMLFAYERLRAFPIDVWIERVLREGYFAGKRRPTPAKLREFTMQYFGKHGGYAQQYLFHHARTGSAGALKHQIPIIKHQGSANHQ